MTRLVRHGQVMGLPDARGGRLSEMERLYRLKLPDFRRVAASVAGDRAAAPDLVQEAFARAVRELDGLREESSLEAWLWRIVVNVARDARRGSRVSVEIPKEHPARPVEQPGSSRQLVGEALMHLSERQRLVVFLRYYAGLDYAQIAEALGIATGTVGATLTTARAVLLESLELKEANT